MLSAATTSNYPFFSATLVNSRALVSSSAISRHLSATTSVAIDLSYLYITHQRREINPVSISAIIGSHFYGVRMS